MFFCCLLGVVVRATSLPRRYHIAGWRDGRLPNASASNAVWASSDGATWALVTPHAQWAAREAAAGLVFRDQLWILGGTQECAVRVALGCGVFTNVAGGRDVFMCLRCASLAR